MLWPTRPPNATSSSLSPAPPPLELDEPLFVWAHYALLALYLLLSLQPLASCLCSRLSLCGPCGPCSAAGSPRDHSPSPAHAPLLHPTSGSPPVQQQQQQQQQRTAPVHSAGFWRGVFHCALSLGCLTRSGYFAYCAVEPRRERRVGEAVFVLNYVPTFLLFTCYYVVLAYWAEAYHSQLARTEAPARAEGVRLRVSAGLAVSSVLSLCTFAAFGVADVAIGDDVRHPSRSTVVLHRVFIVYTSAVYVALALLFALYGFLMTRQVLRATAEATATGVLSDLARNVVLRVAALALLCFACFAARTAVILWAISDSTARVTEVWWWFDVVYYVSLEMGPLCAMLALLRQRRSLRAKVAERASLQPTHAALAATPRPDYVPPALQAPL
eukprot:m51a1_g9776 hypothetical protein (385) ;mRNA; r:1676285-1677860